MKEKRVCCERKRVNGVKEKRVSEVKAEIRAADPAGENGLVISGLPIIFDKPAVIDSPAGRFTEIIRRGALDGADISDVHMFYNHDLSRVPLARTPKTMRLNISPAGLEMTAILPQTEEARAVHTAVARGDLSGMSFAFKVPPGGDRWDREMRTREILKIDKVYEISIVPFPAYPATSIEARSALKEMDNGARDAVIIACNRILWRGGV